MGATLSYLSYASHQQHCPHSHKHASHQLHQGYTPTLVLGNGDPASSSVIDLCARLAALEKDLLISQAGNTNKEAVIQYLLQSSVSNARVKELIVQLKEQLPVLKETIDRTKRENEETQDRLTKAEGSILALSMSSVPSSKPQSTSTSFKSHSDSSSKSDLVTGNLIDLLGYSPKSDKAKFKEEDTTLLDEFYEDESETEGVFKNTTPNQSLHQSSDTEFERLTYITHFTDSDEDAKPQDIFQTPREKLLIPRDSSDSPIPPQQRYIIPVLSEETEKSYSENTSSTSSRESTAVSFNSTSSGSWPPIDVDTELLNGGFSQVKAPDFEGGNLKKSMALVSRLAGSLSSCNTRFQAELPQPITQVSAESQDLQTSFRGNTTEPRWSPERIVDCVKDHQTALLINVRSAQAGAREVPYPGFFKHGIRYVPKVNERDIYRTVVISGLLPSITMMNLLEKVRGGILVDAKLLDTVKFTGSNTALVTFLHERSAKAYENHTKQHPVAFKNLVAQVAIVPTPTWPIPVNLRRSIEVFGRTRCFEVHNIPRDFKRQELTASSVMESESLECMRLVDGVLAIRFASIRAAEVSSAMFGKALRYRGCTIKYIPDPCAQPLETLLQQRIDISEVLGEGTDVPEFIEKNTPGPSTNSEAKAIPREQSGRLTRVDWTIDSELRRGRGFKDRTHSAIDGFADTTDHSIFSSSVSTEEPLRQETIATITAFAQSHFLSD